LWRLFEHEQRGEFVGGEPQAGQFEAEVAVVAVAAALAVVHQRCVEALAQIAQRAFEGGPVLAPVVRIMLAQQLEHLVDTHDRRPSAGEQAVQQEDAVELIHARLRHRLRMPPPVACVHEVSLRGRRFSIRPAAATIPGWSREERAWVRCRWRGF
jgi:hypothetical protein